MSWFKDYFSFSRKERNAFIILAAVMGLFLALPEFFPAKKVTVSLPAAIAENKKTTKANPDQDESWQTPFTAPVIDYRKPHLFYFDPNSIDEDGFVRLGIPPGTARTIINYRNKGGVFRKPEDLRKIYTLKKEDADRIIPYVRIPSNSKGSQPGGHYTTYTSRKSYSVSPIDINTATIEEWKSLPGIGDAYSKRIVSYRERLGGFSSLMQVAKTYNLPDSTFQKILPYLRLSQPASLKININTAHERDLMECSGISEDIAKAIVINRKQHGKFNTLDDLKRIVFLTEEMFQEIAPCLRAD